MDQYYISVVATHSGFGFGSYQQLLRHFYYIQLVRVSSKHVYTSVSVEFSSLVCWSFEICHAFQPLCSEIHLSNCIPL